MWPGINPLTVWGMTYDFWLLYALAAEAKDKHDREQQKAGR